MVEHVAGPDNEIVDVRRDHEDAYELKRYTNSPDYVIMKLWYVWLREYECGGAVQTSLGSIRKCMTTTISAEHVEHLLFTLKESGFLYTVPKEELEEGWASRYPDLYGDAS